MSEAKRAIPEVQAVDRVPEDKPVHEVLLPGKKSRYMTYDPVDVVIEIREAWREQPATVATSRLSYLFSDTPPAVRNNNSGKQDGVLGAVTSEMMYFVGSWNAGDSETWGANRTANRWVNPHYPHRRRLTDCVVRCECGVGVVSGDRSPAILDKEGEHNDDCTVANRYRAQARLHERRVEIIKQMYRYGHNGSDVLLRCGVSPDSNMNRFVKHMHVDLTELREDFWERRANTAAILAERMRPSKIAKVYGISREFVCQEINEKTEKNAGEIAKRREARLGYRGHDEL